MSLSRFLTAYTAPLKALDYRDRCDRHRQLSDLGDKRQNLHVEVLFRIIVQDVGRKYATSLLDIWQAREREVNNHHLHCDIEQY
jgi:hypothetical protein